jgi:uncharacterized protein
MKIIIGGASGLVGRALTQQLEQDGHTLTRLVRRTDQPGIHWQAPTYAIADTTALEGTDAVIHLGGESIIGRWTPAKKQRIRDSRVNSTRALAEALAGIEKKPAVFIVASATGFYGDRGDQAVDESAQPGKGFLADVCVDWEAAAEPARAAGIRVVHLRYSMLLSPAGGALKQIVPIFKLGLGGTLSSGQQYMAWASLDDAVEVVRFALNTPALSGPVNVVSPTPITNHTFTKALGRAVHRPTLFPVPRFAAHLVFGEMSDALLMASQRILPTRLTEAGYQFRHPDIDEALQSLLG